jgi:hypothetical protein
MTARLTSRVISAVDAPWFPGTVFGALMVLWAMLWVLVVLFDTPGLWIPFLGVLGLLFAFGAMTMGGETAEVEVNCNDPAATRGAECSTAMDTPGRQIRLDRPRAAARVCRPHRRFR